MLDNLIISGHATLRDALINMTTHRRGLLFIVDEEQHLVGVLSDGDIRRALLQDVNMNSPIEKMMNLNPIKASSEQEAFFYWSPILTY
ncbi:MAG: CBS domain-containing protein [Saprospiraceae bacterium]|nr:CBS domain-containing protein [Saprospiraceae bacterium]